MRCRWNELQEQSHLDNKVWGVLGKREYEVAGTQSACKSLVKANGESRLRQVEFAVPCQGCGECLVLTSQKSEELLST